MTPTGAAPILQARIQGKRPADLLIVSMVGRLNEVNPVILADGNDWRFVEGLQICVFTKRGKPFRELCKQIAYNGPQALWLWDVENREGATVRLLLDPEKIDKKRFTIDDYVLDIEPWGRIANRDFEDV